MKSQGSHPYPKNHSSSEGASLTPERILKIAEVFFVRAEGWITEREPWKAGRTIGKVAENT